MRHLLLALFFATMGFFQQARAQDRTVTGRVTDASNGQGLPGVTVLGKSTKIGTGTDADGKFSLSLPATVTTLQFTSVGFKAAERDVTSATSVEVSLAVETRNLDEVVVTGLATSIKRSNLANSVATISAQELTGSTRNVTVDAALSGKIAGANISQNSGAPGGGLSVQLRGISTITGESQPLYIIDGVYVNNTQVGNGSGAAAFTNASSGGTTQTSQDQAVNRVSDLNPNDIESIEVLKGPSAAAIYGTRANAGVILIKTKRGVAGQTRVSLTQDLGFARATRLLGVDSWNDAKIDRFYTGQRAVEEKAALAAATASGRIYDYEKEVYGNTGFLRNTAVTVSGGVEKTRFYVSASTTNEDGIVKQTGFQRNSVRANLDQKIGRLVDLSVNSNYINSSNRRGLFGNDNTGIAVGYNLPFIPTYAELHRDPVSGLFPLSRYTPDNPLAVLERARNEEKVNRFIQSASATVHFIEQDNTSLRLALQGGLDYTATNALLYLPPDLQSQVLANNPGAVRVSRNNFFNTNLQGFLIYDWKLLGGDLSLTSQAGTVRLTQEQGISFSQGVNLLPGPPSPDVAGIQTQSSVQTEQADLGLVGQQELNFRDQIIATAGIRFDKSTLYGDEKRYYRFPKASLAVNVAKFGFWSVSAVNQLKLRAAYGETGGVPRFGALFSRLDPLATGTRTGLIQSTVVGNPTIGPERATELEGGFDLGLFNNKVVLEATVYNKKVFDLINTKPLSLATGLSSIQAFPVGDLRNRGLELGLTLTPVNTAFLSWSSTTQFWLNRSEVTRLAQGVAIFDPNLAQGQGLGSTSFGTTRFRVGESPSRWYGTPAVPVTEDNPTGFTRYEEAQPKFQMSFLNSLTIAKNVQVSFLFFWKKDGYVSNLTGLLSDFGGTTADWSEDSGNGVPKGASSRVLGVPGNSARAYIQNAGYVRLREASVYYTIPEAVRTSLFKSYVANIRLGVSGNNLLTWTNYAGYDPEVSNFGNVANGAQTDITPYPNTRRVFFHLGIDF